MAGFDGYICLSDATHIPMLKCSQWTGNIHKGFILNVPARTYNITVDHSRRILGSTAGQPGMVNAVVSRLQFDLELEMYHRRLMCYVGKQD